MYDALVGRREGLVSHADVEPFGRAVAAELTTRIGVGAKPALGTIAIRDTLVRTLDSWVKTHSDPNRKLLDRSLDAALGAIAAFKATPSPVKRRASEPLERTRSLESPTPGGKNMALSSDLESRLGDITARYAKISELNSEGLQLFVENASKIYEECSERRPATARPLSSAESAAEQAALNAIARYHSMAAGLPDAEKRKVLLEVIERVYDRVKACAENERTASATPSLRVLEADDETGAAVAARDAQITEQQRGLDALHRQNKSNAAAQFALECQTTIERLQATIRTSSAEITRLNAAVATSEKKISAHAEELGDLNRRHAAYVAELTKQHDAAVSKLTRDHATTADRIGRAHGVDQARLTALDIAQRNHADEIRTLAAAHAKELAAVKAAHDVAIKNLAAAHAEEIRSLRADAITLVPDETANLRRENAELLARVAELLARVAELGKTITKTVSGRPALVAWCDVVEAVALGPESPRLGRARAWKDFLALVPSADPDVRSRQLRFIDDSLRLRLPGAFYGVTRWAPTDPGASVAGPTAGSVGSVASGVDPTGVSLPSSLPSSLPGSDRGSNDMSEE